MHNWLRMFKTSKTHFTLLFSYEAERKIKDNVILYYQYYKNIDITLTCHGCKKVLSKHL